METKTGLMSRSLSRLFKWIDNRLPKLAEIEESYLWSGNEDGMLGGGNSGNRNRNESSSRGFHVPWYCPLGLDADGGNDDKRAAPSRDRAASIHIGRIS
jgi:hypothetical protein